MLWKYKKCYQETSEDVTITPPKTCRFIDSVYYINNEGSGNDIGINFLLCNNSEFNTYTIQDNSTININKCFIGDSLVVTYSNLSMEVITKAEILDAIENNGGVLIKTKIFGDYIVFNFSLCP